MQAQISETITSTSVVLFNPLVIAALAVAVVALATGLAGRLAVFVEDVRYGRSHNASADRLG